MKITWGHGVVIALGAFIIFILGMIFLFPIGKQNSELISDNYYEDELHYQEVIDAKNLANTLVEKPKIALLKDGITVVLPGDINNTNSKFNFYLFRTDDKNLDIKKDFVLNQNNALTIPNTVLVKGSYTLKLQWVKEAKKYQIDYDIKWK